MKAIRLIAPKQPLEEQEVPIPSIESDEVLVQIKACGICHSDVHYRGGISSVDPFPLTLGHEIAGIVTELGSNVKKSSTLQVGDRVCLHYNLTCGNCDFCISGKEQFCVECKMLGHYAHGGYAEYIAVPARNALKLPLEISMEQGATLMCASATALHALKKSDLKVGERVAIFGVGGLGFSAVQLAIRAFGALDVYAVDTNADKLALAERYGAIPIHVQSSLDDPVAEIQKRTNGLGVDVAIEFIGLPQTIQQTIQCLAPMGRAVIVGISNQEVMLNTYRHVLGKEAQIIGSNDHWLSELPLLLEFARRKILDLSHVVTRTVPLQAKAINAVLDELENSKSNAVRTVIVP